MNRVLSLIVILLSLPANALAADSLEAGRGAYYFEDKNSSLVVDDILNMNPSEMQTSSKPRINIGRTTSTLWVVIPNHFLDNFDNHNNTILWYSSGFLANVDIYLIDKEKTATYHKSLGMLQGGIGQSHIKTYYPNVALPNLQEVNSIVIRVNHTTGTSIFPRISTSEHFNQKQNTIKSVYWFYLGAVFILFTFNFVIGILVREPDFLYYLLYLACTTVCVLNLESITYLFATSPAHGLFVRYLFWISISVNMFACLHFQSRFTDLAKIAPRYYRYFNIFAVLSLLPMVLLPFSRSVAGAVIMVAVLCWALVSIATGIYTWIRGSKDAKYFLLGFSFFITSVVLVSLHSQGKFGSLPTHILLIGSLLEATIFTVTLAKRMKRIHQETLRSERDQLKRLESAYESSEIFRRKLEKEVRSRVSEIQAILDHVPQGLFRIKAGSKILVTQSHFLNKFFPGLKIDEDFYTKLIAELWQADANQRSIVKAIIKESLGTDPLTFEINYPHLPLQMDVASHGDTKTLQVTWTPIVEDGVVISILVTLFDITNQIVMEERDRQHVRQMEKITRVVEVGEAGCQQFINLVHKTILSVERACHSSKFVLEDVMVLLHTLKGEARTMKFADLAERLHILESLALESEKNNMSKDFIKCLSQLKDDLAQYEFVAQQILGFRSKKQNSLPGTHRRRQIPIDSLHHFCEQVAITSSKELGCPSPLININCQCQEFDGEVLEQIRFVLGHAVNNSIAHGFAHPRSQIDPCKFAIDINLIDSHDRTIIKYCDNGNGLNCSKLMPENPTQPDLTDLRLRLAMGGLSTANELSSIAGRGYGITAIVAEVEKQGGSLDIEAKGEITLDNTFYWLPFGLTITLRKKPAETLSKSKSA